MPIRIQLRRWKGWRKPPGVVVVSRPSKWGNPYRVGDRWPILNDKGEVIGIETIDSEQRAVDLYRAWVTPHADIVREHLAGRELACWCALDAPCHADVLLELANN